MPGAIEAWEAILKAHGRFGLDRALQAAIGYAENGYVIAPRVGSDWAEQVGKLKPHAGSAKYYLPNGEAPAIGSIDAAARACRDAEGDRGGRREGVLRGRDRGRHRGDGSGRRADCWPRKISRATTAMSSRSNTLNQ